MSFRYFASLIILSLVLVACADTTATEPITVTENPRTPTTYPGPIISTIPAYPNPEPTMDTSVPTNPAYPEPGTAGTGTLVIPPSGYEPQPGDENMGRDQVYLDLFNSQIVTTATAVNSVEVVLQGDLPDPCHELRVVITPADANNVINLDVYSVIDPAATCIAMVEPFTASIPLGNYASGQYTVMVNDEKLGEFGNEYGPQPGDENLRRDQVFLDLANSQFSTPDTPTSYVEVVLKGDLPDPCHQLRVVVTPPDANNVINLDAYSVVDPADACITELKPFTASIPLGNYSNGQYSVMVNGERLGEFSAGSGVAPAVPVTP